MNRLAKAERLAAIAAAQAMQGLGERRVTTLAAHDTRCVALIGLRRADEAEPIMRRQLAILAEKRRWERTPARAMRCRSGCTFRRPSPGSGTACGFTHADLPDANRRRRRSGPPGEAVI
jgi:hypothetical protein